MPASNPKEAKLEGEAVANKSGNLDVSATQSALEAIDKCQNDLDSLNEKASEEILAVEQKYNRLRRPHYEKRSQVIDAIPDFWYNTLVNHPHIASMLSSEDQECLQCLKSVNVEEFDDIKSGYKISFFFKENNFFTNSELVKEFQLVSVSAKPVTKSSTIDWKDGKDLTKVAAQGKSRKRHFAGHSSFFSWFVKNGDPLMDEIAETIKDDIWVNPLQYYLASEIDISAENGLSDDEDDDDLNESVVVIGDDDSEDEDDDDDGEDPEIFEVGDDDDEEDDDDDVEEIEGGDEE